MKKSKHDSISVNNVEEVSLIISLLNPHRNKIESVFSKTLEELINNKKSWERVRANRDQLPGEAYKILANIDDFGKEQFRDKILSILEKSSVEFERTKSCQYLVAKILLHCPEKIEVLASLRLTYTRRSFFHFSITSDFPKQYSICEFSKIIKETAKIISGRRTGLEESVEVSADDRADDNCWHFDIKWCDKIKPANVYDKEKKVDDFVVLPMMDHSLIRYDHGTKEIEINIDSVSRARDFMKTMCGIIWNDARTHFQEKSIFTLEPLKNRGTEVLRICHPDVKKSF